MTYSQSLSFPFAESDALFTSLSANQHTHERTLGLLLVNKRHWLEEAFRPLHMRARSGSAILPLHCWLRTVSRQFAVCFHKCWSLQSRRVRKDISERREFQRPLTLSEEVCDSNTRENYKNGVVGVVVYLAYNETQNQQRIDIPIT